MKRKLVVNLLCILLLVLLISSTTVTLAAWSVRSDTINTVSISNVRAVIEETYTQGQKVIPGVAADKVVRVKNTGDQDCHVRVKIDCIWLEGYDADGNPIPSETLSMDKIRLIINETNWYEADGYYYYKGVLKPGESTEPLMEQFYLDGEVSSEYQDKEANIIVRMECIQAGETELGLWGLDYKTLGIVYERVQPVNQVTRVILKGQEGFAFPDNGGDLFSNFKSLVPGESRTQKVDISNAWTGKKVDISFYAEVADQPQATAATADLIDKLLKEHVQIKITDPSGTVLYEGAVWGNLNATVQSNGTMRYAIPLGSFATGDSKMLTVSLSANSQMGNEYTDLLGHVKWVFLAEGDEDTDNPGGENPGGENPGGGNPGGGNPGGGIGTEVPKNPGTGDEVFWIGLVSAAGSAVLLLITMKARKKTKA